MADYELGTGDLEPRVRMYLKDGADNAIDLTDATVRFVMGPHDLSAAAVLDETATVESAAEGLVEYAWAAGDTDTAGSYVAQFIVTFPGTRPQHVPARKGRMITINIHQTVDGVA